MDRARKKTDKILNQTRKKINKIYTNNPRLNKSKKEYFKYMDLVRKKVDPVYQEYLKENDAEKKAELKQQYGEAVKKYTLGSKEYNIITKRLVKALSETNEEALDFVNDKMIDVYTINYNQVAVDCKKAGIQVYEENKRN